MNYSVHFKEKEDEQLLELLSNRKVLNFEAQRCLLHEIEKRSLEVDAQALRELNQLIDIEQSKIRDFQYLPFLGFSIKSDGETVIKRLGGARRVDLFSAFFAVVMMFSGVPLTTIIIDFMENGLTGAGQVIGFIVCIAVVIYGILLFLRSLERIFDFWRFEILKTNDSLFIKKGSDTYSLDVATKSSLRVASRDGRTKLVLARDDDREPITLMSTDGGLRLHLTLKHLRDYLVQ